jgi:hypothetical protein
MSECHWNNLTRLDLSNPQIIEAIIKSETQVASG